MNELLDAAREKSEEQDSSDRYRDLKKEEAGTDQNKAEKRYQKLKEEAKEEFIEQTREREQEQEDASEEESESSGDGFITH